MARIFTTLAAISLASVAVILVVGLALGDMQVSEVALGTLARVHRLGGVAAALMVVLANSIVVTYFIGTSRWVKEVSETYLLDARFVAESNRIKRRTFPWAVISMLAVVALLATGGAADPGSAFAKSTAPWATAHLIAALSVLAFLGWASVHEWNNITANQQVIASVLEEVKRIRDERGLD